MTKAQAIITTLLGATLVTLGIEGDGYLHHAMLVWAGVCFCGAFTI